MTEKQTVLSNLNRKQRMARKRALRRPDAAILAEVGVALVAMEDFKRPAPLPNPVWKV